MTAFYRRRLENLSQKQSEVICDYISAVSVEIGLSDNYKKSILNTLVPLSLKKIKSYKDFTRADIINFLNQFRKSESEEPSHKWIGTYNTHLVNIIRFFKWLYKPDFRPKERPKPKVVQNLPRLSRKEVSGYKPADMWKPEDNLIFLKYCPSPRDRCYHGMEMDTSARPHELLKLRIKDVEFIEEGGTRYAKIVVNGKTGERSLPLIDSIPYTTQWISLHPQGSNREAILFPNPKTGKQIQEEAMQKAYKRYKKYFTSLLSENIPQQDKKRINELLKRRWNPYCGRHSSLTEKCEILSDNSLRQFAGWTLTSQMNRKYIHFSGGESMKDILRAKGILKENSQPADILQPKTCPQCRESNRPDAAFCFKCQFVLSFEAYQKGVEDREKKDRETKDVIVNLSDQVDALRQELRRYQEKFGHLHFAPREYEKIKQLLVKLENMPKDDDDFVQVED